MDKSDINCRLNALKLETSGHNRNGNSILLEGNMNHSKDAPSVLQEVGDNSVDNVKALNNNEDELIQPMCNACATGNVDAVKKILDIGIDINVSDADGIFPIHHTIDSDCDDRKVERVHALQTLIQAKCDVNVVDNMGRTALYLACEAEDVDAVKLLLENGSDVNLQTVAGDSPIKVCSRNLYLETLHHGIITDDIAALDIKMIDSSLSQIVKMLLKKRADLSETILLHTAVGLGDAQLVEELLDLGMDVNMWDDDMATPLGIACSCELLGPQIVKILIERGADVNKRTTGFGFIQNSLELASFSSSIDKIKLLVSSGAKMSSEKMTELASKMLQYVLQDPEFITQNHEELLTYRLLMAHGFSPVIQGTKLYDKVHQLRACSSYSKISEWIQGFLYPVHSLQEQCRISVRRSMQISIDEKIDDLPVTGVMKDFLKVSEISQIYYDV